MNIIPPNYNGKTSIKTYSPPVIQNNISFNLPKQKTLKTSSQDASKDDDEKKHISDLSKRLPGLTNIFNLHRKIGEGSFSSVFLASLKCDDHVPEEQRKLFAIKHLVPTSHPSRIEQELRCLKYIGGCENVVGLDFCMRKYDTVIFVMPYLPHTKFSEYVLKMDVMETKVYMKNLLLALRRVHQFNIIHRDVKPSNFLYDRVNRRFLLVDFGLAQKIDSWPTSNNANDNLPTCDRAITSADSQIVSTIDQSQVNGKKRKFNDISNDQPLNESEPKPKRQNLVSNIGIDSTPLKPLQEDHPKITPSPSYPQSLQQSHLVSSKLSSVKRQVLVENENSLKQTNCLSNRNEHSSQTPQLVNNLVTNNVNCNLPPSMPNPINYNVSQSTYHPPSYSLCANALELQKIAQYYSYYNALSFNNLLVNNMLTDTGGKNSIDRNTLEYNFYRNQMTNHLIQSNLMNYNNLYASHSKFAPINNYSYVSQAQPSVVNHASHKLATAGNQVPLDRGNHLAKQVRTKQDSLRKDSLKVNSATVKLCGCAGKPSVCSVCLGRAAYNAPRAGTQGFRPPEVLLKYTEQTTAVDLWACGVILLSVVSGCYPFFKAPDDLTALAEMVTIFGSKALKNVAGVLGRHLMCSHSKKALDLRKLCSHLRYRALKSNNTGNSDLVKSTIDHLQQDNVIQANNEKTPSGRRSNYTKNVINWNSVNSSKSSRSNKNVCQDCLLCITLCVCASEEVITNCNGKDDKKIWCGFPEEAFDLLERLLDLNPHTRITASEALKHPFLADL